MCDAQNRNEQIGFVELPIKQIYDSEAMTINKQTFTLRNLSEPLDTARIVLHLSLLVSQFSKRKSIHFIYYIEDIISRMFK